MPLRALTLGIKTMGTAHRFQSTVPLRALTKNATTAFHAPGFQSTVPLRALTNYLVGARTH
ncbi:hypothetical protein CLOSTMETH_02494 [[Clostridium] methylpentosum DSM 5476]|uniref:Uncharacterized protein n=1 Tax=[Clostridium] methylpentosum DSM 5476 TaxID=537013 RepID=C0EF53_9FIRM|nr:hypothetical protein CLOSTMETH_02494 [[Clostridium] methylpentosum DSM 5476]